MQIFEHTDYGKIRVVEIDGQTWFAGKDVTEILGYRNPSEALKYHVDDEDKLNSKSLSGLGQRGGWLINESGLYSLILSSKLPSAKAFKRWLTSEVLPSIRRHGAYVSDNVLDRLIDNPEAAMRYFAILKEERAKKDSLEKKHEALTEYMAELTPKARYYDVILQCPGAILVTVIAKDYGYSAVKFNKLLHALGVQYKAGTVWVLYQDHADKGYTVTKTYEIKGKKSSAILTCYTQRGRLWLYNLLKSIGNPASYLCSPI
jgi:prophage antirepressor-like protein